MYIEIINEEFDPWQKLVEYKRAQLKDKNNIGACSVFLGTMTDINSGDEIKSMELQHYPEMTESYLEKIVERATKKFKIIDSIVFLVILLSGRLELRSRPQSLHTYTCLFILNHHNVLQLLRTMPPRQT